MVIIYYFTGRVGDACFDTQTPPSAVPPLDLIVPLTYMLDFTDYTLLVENKMEKQCSHKVKKKYEEKMCFFSRNNLCQDYRFASRSIEVWKWRRREFLFSCIICLGISLL